MLRFIRLSRPARVFSFACLAITVATLRAVPVPAGASAVDSLHCEYWSTLQLPTTDASTVKENGQAIAQTPGVRFLKSDKSAAYFALESGTYNFSCAGLTN